MKQGIIGKKIGMTQIFDESGKVIPVTVVEAGPYMVIQKNNVVIQVNLEIPGSAAEPTPEELARLILLQIQ